MLSGPFFMAHTGQTYNRRRPWPLKLNLPGTFCIPLFLLLVKGFDSVDYLFMYQCVSIRTSLHRFSKKEEASQFSRQRCSQVHTLSRLVSPLTGTIVPRIILVFAALAVSDSNGFNSDPDVFSCLSCAPCFLSDFNRLSIQRVTDKSNTFSSGFSIPVMTRILDFTDKLTQKITEAVEFIIVSQHFSNTDHDEDDSQATTHKHQSHLLCEIGILHGRFLYGVMTL
ncbi:hypothetical protein HID58_047681 [Brassica napus]|uniref:Uncharacterized protein n=1 Tax=Brassica napus TaxID=3708 RepID=A0ABQ8B050_BRANA|nr:hypothetical protein HID58_047681 [Brassica napus]